MRADIHYGQEHQSSTHGPDTDVQDQSLRRSHRACNTHALLAADLRLAIEALQRLYKEAAFARTFKALRRR